MGHREDLLAGAVRCLREKGYSRTTARDIVAASGTNLGSIGYHYGSTEALLNAAVMQAIDEFATELAHAMTTDVDPHATALERFEQYWTRVIDSFAANRQVWLATFDVFGLAERVPQVRAALADGLRGGRMAWALMLHNIDGAVDERKARAVGSLHQALLSGVIVQWLIDPEQAPSGSDLAYALRTIADDVAANSDATPARPREPDAGRGQVMPKPSDNRTSRT
jgi:AcrR family transcriptional regulator